MKSKVTPLDIAFLIADPASATEVRLAKAMIRVARLLNEGERSVRTNLV